jgi:NADH:quinone reductase (non-electrogenic)
VVVGGGFAVACAKHLAKHGVSVTVIDRHDYNQFQPLLYQVAPAQVETYDVARPLRAMFPKRDLGTVTMADTTDMRPVMPWGHRVGADPVPGWRISTG